MLPVITINILYLRTFLIKQPGLASPYRGQICSMMFTEELSFCPEKANTSLETKNIFFRYELKQCINKWKITELSNPAKRHEDNSGNQAYL